MELFKGKNESYWTDNVCKTSCAIMKDRKLDSVWDERTRKWHIEQCWVLTKLRTSPFVWQDSLRSNMYAAVGCISKNKLRSGSIFVSLCNKIPAGEAKRRQSLIQTFYETSAPTFLIDCHLPNHPTKITFVACFSSMQIFHAWKKCRLADLNSFYLLIFSAKNKTVSTITFNFLRG